METIFLATFFVDNEKQKRIRLVSASFIEDARVKILSYYEATDDCNQRDNAYRFISDLEIHKIISDMTTEQLNQFLKDNGIEPTTENLLTCVLDRHESIIVQRTKQRWVIKKGDCYATEYTQDEALLSLMNQLIIEGEMTTKDFLYNYNLNK